MVLVEVGNSESKVTGLSIEQQRALKSVLSYFIAPPGSYVAKQFGVKKVSLLSKAGVFPSGLLPWVIEKLKDIPGATLNDVRRVPTAKLDSIRLNLGLEPYPEQKAIVDSCLRYKRGTISACTGFGKSVTMALLIGKLKLRTLIVVPNLELKRQLSQSLSEWFPDMSNITVENIDSKRLNKATNYDCLIIDEAHHVAASTYRKLNKTAWTGIYHRYFFTATPYRSIKEEQLLFESIAGQVIHEVTYEVATSKGYIVPMEAYYIDVPKTKTTGNTWAKVYSDIVVNNTARNAIIQNLLINLKAEKKSTLCLVKEIKHGAVLSSITGVHFANGQDEDSADMIKFFSKGKLNSLIGTTGVLSEGVDTKPAEYIIIAGLGKSRNAFVQMCGRGFRNWVGKETCKIIIFRDNSHKWSLDHFKHQVKYLKDEFGVEIERIDI